MPTPAEPSAGAQACESCGAPADDTAPVHRVYLRPPAVDPLDGGAGHGDGDQQVDVLTEVERWCLSCRSQYPHQPLTG
jgi:hypothetical protein